MTEQEIHEFVHESVHQLIDVNKQLQKKFNIGAYKRYDYDMDKETLIFSNQGIPYVRATIQVAGSISKKSKTWLWGWANPHVPDNATKKLGKVRAFGEKHGIRKLMERKWEATEEDGWEMSAVCNRLIKGKGVYRCPDKSGFLFLVLTNIRRAR